MVPRLSRPWTTDYANGRALPPVFVASVRPPGGSRTASRTRSLAALPAFITVLVVGVLRRWPWTFWLILVAFGFGVLRVPVAILQLTHVLV